MDIAIWGTGVFGNYVERQLRDNQNYVVRYFIDSNPDLWGQQLNGIEIISPNQLQREDSVSIAFTLIAFMDGIEIYETLLQKNIGKFGIIRNRVLDAELVLSDNLMQDRDIVWSDAAFLRKPMIKSLETNIVDDCNLNCRGCSHFSNLFQHGEKVPFSVFCRDMEQIAEHAYIHRFDMLGGEALLNGRITEYMEYARKLLPYTDIQLVTNGLLLLKQPEEFFHCCADNDITISISSYPPTLRIKNQLKDILDAYHIVFIFREEVNEFGKNIDLSGMVNAREAVKRCRENKCQFLRYGKLYKCPFEALGNTFFTYYDLDIRFHGGIDIFDENLNWFEVVKELSHTFIPVDACRYCGEEQKIAWSVSGVPVLEDWVISEKNPESVGKNGDTNINYHPNI